MNKTIYVATAITPGIYEDIVKIMASSFAKNNTCQLHIYCLNFTDAQYEDFCYNFGVDGNITTHRIEYHCKYTTTNTGKYTDILDSTSCKFKIFSQSVTEDYFLWLDADTLITKNIDSITSFIKLGDIAGNPKNNYVPIHNLEYNAGVILLRNVHKEVLFNYEQYLDGLVEHNPHIQLDYADELFMRYNYRNKAVLPTIYNSRYTNYNKTAIIQHLYGNFTPWLVSLRKMPRDARLIADMWLTEYTNIKNVLSATFTDKVDGLQYT